MAGGGMHADEIGIDEALVRRLLGAQFPRWADLRLEPVPSGGTENAIYRLGHDMAVRLPRRPGKSEQVQKLHRWLPRLGPRLPLAVPVPLAMGRPCEEYPCPWSIYPWLEGETATLEGIADPVELATALAEFVTALRRVHPGGGPAPGAHNFFRGMPLADRDPQTRAALAALDGVIDTDAAAASWEESLAAPAWNRPPVWVHGDLKSDNLLLVEGRLRAVIDFGGLGVGDPACDLIIAWDLLSGESRNVYRDAVAADDAAWLRGRGWALYVALSALPYYRDTNPAMMLYARRLLGEVLAG